jgi:hypothetical protein
MKRILVATGLFTISLAFLFGSNSTSAQEGPQLSTSAPKGKVAEIEVYTADIDKFVKSSLKTERIFANVASAAKNEPVTWREFSSEDERKKVDTGDNLTESAFVWLRDGKVVGANFTFQGPARDWDNSVMYYFRDNGSLAKSDSKLNTMKGGIVVVRQDYYDSKGILLKGTTHCRDIATQQSKPCGEFSDRPAPLFATTRQLPFYGLLAKRS